MAHDHHDHDHHCHGHHHAPASFGTAFAIGTTLNLGFALVELGVGFAANSLALVSDALHNFSDVVCLLLAWGAAWLATRAPTASRTYGYRRASILAALANAALLVAATGAILTEAVQRLLAPQPIAAGTVLAVAALGILINTAIALMFMRGRSHDLNLKGAFLHMAGDAAISVGVVVAGFLILLTGWQWIDPVVSLGIAAVIVAGTWSLLRESLSMTLQGVPPNIDINAVRGFLEQCPGVCAIHDLHVWPMSTTETALTCHMVMLDGHPGDDALHKIADDLNHHFKIPHTTIQVEITNDADCALAREHAV